MRELLPPQNRDTIRKILFIGIDKQISVIGKEVIENVDNDNDVVTN